MPNWRIKESPTGDTATFRETVRETIIEGFVRDCDGDFVSYQVKENGNVTLQGDVHRGDGLTQSQAWNEAIRRASVHIMTDPNPKPVKTTNKRRDADDTEGSKGVKVYKGFDELPYGKQKKGKGGGRKHTEKRDKWADA